MPVCRFYQMGTCRYGKNCRFDHIDPGSDGRGVSVMRGGYNNQQEQHYRDDNSNRYVWTRDQDRSPQGRSPMGSHGQYQGSHHRGGSQEFYGNQDYGRSQERYRSPERYAYDHEYGRSNRPPPQVHSGRPQEQRYSGSQNYGREHGREQDRFHYSKDQELPSRGKDNNFQELSQCVSADMSVLDAYQVWKLTSYGPHKQHGSFDGWYDHSPEELRLAAYQAKERDKGNEYRDALSRLFQQAKQLREVFKNPKTAMDAIREYQKQSPGTVHCCPDGALCWCVNLASTYSPMAQFAMPPDLKSPTADTEMEATNYTLLAPRPPSHNIFGLVPPQPTSQTPSAPNSVEQIFGFTEADIDYKLLSFMWKGHTPYSNLQDFTDDQISQFKAAQFTPGQVPLIPPPREFL